MTQRIYIAAPFSEWPTAASLRAYLRAHQVDCTASWIDEASALNGREANAALETAEEWEIVGARNDADVIASHAVVSLVFDKGREQYEECGFARANGVPVVYVDHGGALHLSTRRACNRLVPDWGALVCELVALRERGAA